MNAERRRIEQRLAAQEAAIVDRATLAGGMSDADVDAHSAVSVGRWVLSRIDTAGRDERRSLAEARARLSAYGGRFDGIDRALGRVERLLRRRQRPRAARRKAPEPMP